MTDIYVGLILVYCFSAALVLAGVRFSRAAPRWASLLLAVLILALMFYSGMSWHDNLRLAEAVPLTNLIVVGDVLPMQTGVLVGLAWPLMLGSVRRKLLILVPFILIGSYQANRPLFARTPDVGNKWRDSVALQTSPATCGPAAAATLLQSADIAATESELASLCLTTDNGTSMLGLYRGLKIKTRDSAWTVRTFTGTRAELEASIKSPILISLALPNAKGVDPRFAQSAGWIPGVPHTVVLFRFLPNDRVEIGDPAVGMEIWPTSDLDVLWRGEGLYLSRRM